MGWETDPGQGQRERRGGQGTLCITLHNPCDICQAKLSYIPILERHWQFVVRTNKINFYILNTGVFVISSLCKRSVNGEGRKEETKHLLKEVFS